MNRKLKNMNKIQETMTNQYSGSNAQIGNLDIDHWNLFGVCLLVIGYSFTAL